jgi:hypothetical protein
VSELDLLLRHLRQQASECPLSPNAPSWLGQVQAGEFEAIPQTLAWDTATQFAHLIDCYTLCQEAGLGDPFEYEEIKREESKRLGRWIGSALELWVCLFLEYRRDRFQGGWLSGDEPQLDVLCRDLRARLIEKRQAGPECGPASTS